MLNFTIGAILIDRNDTVSIMVDVKNHDTKNKDEAYPTLMDTRCREDEDNKLFLRKK